LLNRIGDVGIPTDPIRNKKIKKIIR